jgi:probable rRNA maturation factor
MYQIDVVNRQSALRVNSRRLRDGVRRALEGEGVDAAEISVAVVGDSEMQELNRTHLRHDYPTDVLSFLFDVEAARRSPDNPVRGESRCRDNPVRGPHDGQDCPSYGVDRGTSGKPVRRIDGEVVVSAETALRRAPEFDWHPAWELLLYVVHGTLHLCGHDDQTPAERRRMRRRERAILQNWGMRVSYRRRR